MGINSGICGEFCWHFRNVSDIYCIYFLYLLLLWLLLLWLLLPCLWLLALASPTSLPSLGLRVTGLRSVVRLRLSLSVSFSSSHNLLIISMSTLYSPTPRGWRGVGGVGLSCIYTNNNIINTISSSIISIRDFLFPGGRDVFSCRLDFSHTFKNVSTTKKKKNNNNINVFFPPSGGAPHPHSHSKWGLVYGGWTGETQILPVKIFTHPWFMLLLLFIYQQKTEQWRKLVLQVCGEQTWESHREHYQVQPHGTDTTSPGKPVKKIF